ncbi:adenosylcobinamide-GDP ribazoletransferase [Rhodobacteraceae bacterium]|nr:adenosylcobinamide-GDP ribazoletransferase [Paracoccaceae bacterium]
MQAQLAAMMLSRLPVGRLPDGPHPLGAAAWAFALVGMGLGMIGAGVFWLGGAMGLPDFARALVVLGAMIWLTGALHEDGLADLADGLGGGTTPARKLEIMRDSRLGSYGAVALILALGLRACGIAALAAHGAGPWAIVALAIASRAQMVIWQAYLPPARSDGMGHAAQSVPRSGVIVALLMAAAGALPLGSAMGPVLLAVGLGGGVVAFLAHRQIGGQTGDVLGASQQAAEITGWLAVMIWLGQ